MELTNGISKVTGTDTDQKFSINSDIRAIVNEQEPTYLFIKVITGNVTLSRFKTPSQADTDGDAYSLASGDEGVIIPHTEREPVQYRLDAVASEILVVIQ